MSNCIVSWGSQIDKIRLLQKRAIRNVTKSAYTAHTEPLYKEYNGCKSEKMLITTEVPQGSMLGPFLFTICINDLPSCSKIFEMIMYADDTTLYCNINGVPNIQPLLNAELSKISD